MARKVMQFRYYNDSSLENQPNKTSGISGAITKAKLTSGSIFSAYLPITQLGIQTVPGTKFYLNNSNNPIVVGYTGIYELSLEGKAEISSLSFDAKSLEAINGNANSYLIVDIIYEGEG